MAYSGEPGDTNNFADFVERNLRLYHIRSVPTPPKPYTVLCSQGEADVYLLVVFVIWILNSNHVPLLPPSASAWIRRTIAEALRSRTPYAVNLLLGGYDTTTDTPHLYWIDYLGTKAIVPYAAHGVGMYVSLSTMDKWWQPEMGRAEGIDVLKRCIDEVEKSEIAILCLVFGPANRMG